MKEVDLHQFWNRTPTETVELRCSNGSFFKVIDAGQYNHNSGPDFLNACLEIDGILWHGNVEIHLRSSDWLRHGHNSDPAYQDLLLHVVYEDDIELRLNCLTWELSSDARLNSLFRQQVRSRNNPSEVVKQAIVEDRTFVIQKYLDQTLNDWEESWYRLLSRSMGFHTNSMPFEWLAIRTPLKVLRMYTDDICKIEAILFGQAGLLNGDGSFNTYREMLLGEYRILRIKHALEPIERGAWKFSRMRPNNAPHVRIAQLAALIGRMNPILSSVLSNRFTETFQLFEVHASAYWNHHFHFGRKSPNRKKQLGHTAIGRLFKDAVIPFCKVYGEKHGIKDNENVLMKI